MKTGYFWKATHEPEPGVQYVSISRQKQRGAEHIPTYEALLPSWDIIKMAHEANYSPESFFAVQGFVLSAIRQIRPC